MTLELLRENFPEFAKDIKLNLGTILTPEGAPGLKLNQIWSIALATSYSLKNRALIEAIESAAQDKVSTEEIHAAKAAATIMAMNNIYYRSMHFTEDAELQKLPAKLRMTIIGKPGVDKPDFEAYCVAVSAINGCGQCVGSHVANLKKEGWSNEAAQSVIRIASVLSAASQAQFLS